MKKLNKFFAVLVALAMMAMLCVITALAEPATEEQINTPEDTKIFKYLTVPAGVTVPTATFEIDFTPVSDSSGAAASTMPAIGALANPSAAKSDDNLPTNKAYITIDPSDASTVGYTKDGNSVFDSITVADIIANTTFEHAGVYLYKAQENQYASAIKAANGETFDQTKGETITIDRTEYELRLVVEKQADGTYRVTQVTVTLPDGKIKITNITEPVEGDGSDNEGAVQGFTYKNVYQKDITNTTDGALALSKAVARSDGKDESTFAEGETKLLETDKDFAFVLTLNPALGVDATAKIPATIDGTEKLLEYGDNNIELKAGQTLKIPTLPAGTTYSVNEDLDGTRTTVEKKSKYQPSYVVTTKDTDTTKAKEETGKIGEDLDTASFLFTDQSTGDKVAYTNTLDVESTTPTGILISNLPYIALALVAIGGLVAYVVVRRRQSDEA